MTVYILDLGTTSRWTSSGSTRAPVLPGGRLLEGVRLSAFTNPLSHILFSSNDLVTCLAFDQAQSSLFSCFG